MTSTLRCVAIAIACLALWSITPATTSADIPRPRESDQRNSGPRPSRNDQLVTLEIEGTDGWQGYLYVPESMLVADATAAPSGMSAIGTTVSGVALSLSMIFGGLWLAKSRKRLGTHATVTAASILVVLVGTATYALANASPYPLANLGTLRKAAPAGEPLSGQIRLIRVPDEGEKKVRLVLPREEK